MYSIMKNVLLTILVLNQVLGSTEATNCYGASQGACTTALTNLWNANQKQQYGNICKHFGELNTCTMNYLAKCKFSQYETDLYRKDIVQTFTGNPYSCPMIGGNMMFAGDKDTASIVGQNNIAFCCIISVLTFICFMDQTG